MLLVPFLTYFLELQGVSPGLAVKMAIATSMSTIMFTSLSSVRAHHQRRAVRWDLVRRLAPGIAMGGLVASLGVFSLLRGSALVVVFAVFVGFSAVRMLGTPPTASTCQMPSPAGQLGLGQASDFFRALLAQAAASSAFPS